MKIAVAMSGGVDSSVAAALMVQKYGAANVFGVTAKFFCYSGEVKEKACCSLEAINDAKAVCDKLGIAHYVISEEEEFRKAVIDNFVQAYRLGQTPIPCIPCNTIIKFGTMLQHVRKLGAEKLVTGHYARIKKRGQKYYLLRGIDKNKDQTYFLHGLSQKQLARIDFPVGGMKKPKVRAIAKKFGLKTAEKKESQGVCFISEGTVADWLVDKIERKPGKIVDSSGKVIGEHEGIALYTIGQRKRIGGGYDKPMFVVGINAKKNEVVIGDKDDLYQKDLEAGNIHWINELKLPLRCTAKIRYNMEGERCIVSRNKRYSVAFKRPQRAITPGQSTVFYKGDICLGGGVIDSA